MGAGPTVCEDGQLKMNLSDFEKLLETQALRELNEAEQGQLEVWLREHPDDREIWEEERALSRAITELPDEPVASNFTAQVWDRIEAESREVERIREQVSVKEMLLGSWLKIPRLAWFCAFALTVGVLVNQQRLHDRAKVAENLVPVAELAQVPSVEALQDFEAINSLGEPMVSGDVELLAVLEGLE